MQSYMHAPSAWLTPFKGGEAGVKKKDKGKKKSGFARNKAGPGRR